jgi:hypothetical protein
MENKLREIIHEVVVKNTHNGYDSGVTFTVGYESRILKAIDKHRVCKNCKYWEFTHDGYPNGDAGRYGDCLKINEKPYDKHICLEDEFYVGENFGCIHFEEK